MRIIKLVPVITFLVSSAVPAGAAELVPKDMTGIRMAPDATDCQTAERIFLINASSVLIFEQGSAEERVVLGPASAMEGALLLSRPGGEVILGTSFGDYERCDRLPSRYYALFGEALALFEAFDQIARACEGENGQDCLDAAFRFADVSGDGELGPAEISRVLRAVAFFLTYEGVVANRKNVTDPWEALQVPVTDLAGGAAVASFVSPFFSDNLVSSYDFDGSGAVSLAELMQDRGADELAGAMGTLGSAAAQTGLQALFGALQQLLGALPGMMLR